MLDRGIQVTQGGVGREDPGPHLGAPGQPLPSPSGLHQAAEGTGHVWKGQRPQQPDGGGGALQGSRRDTAGLQGWERFVKAFLEVKNTTITRKVSTSLRSSQSSVMELAGGNAGSENSRH